MQPSISPTQLELTMRTLRIRVMVFNVAFNNI
jgi:hypothetical protein